VLRRHNTSSPRLVRSRVARRARVFGVATPRQSYIPCTTLRISGGAQKAQTQNLEFVPPAMV
jgi:hypothetical protein